ncbi:hypothetical protein KC723_02045 [Candidatus Kaiserbacteria bacterium]|nr:hypothetical protein [Candidatus Kaiserbacteria bacterium]
MSNFLKNLLSIAVIVLVGLAGYYIFVNKDTGELDLTGRAGLDAEILASTQLFIERGRILDSISLETDLFTDLRFTSLVSYSTEVPEIPLGRENPFLPVENRNN